LLRHESSLIPIPFSLLQLSVFSMNLQLMQTYERTKKHLMSL
jgi:hypothetical protein